MRSKTRHLLALALVAGAVLLASGGGANAHRLRAGGGRPAASPSSAAFRRRLVNPGDGQTPCNAGGCMVGGTTWVSGLSLQHDNIFWRCAEPGMVALTFDDGNARDVTACSTSWTSSASWPRFS